MNDSWQKKRRLEGYMGVEFRAIGRSDRQLPQATSLYIDFIRNCDRLKAHHMTQANGGNVSVR